MPIYRQTLYLIPLAAAVYSRDTLGVCLGLSWLAFMSTDALIPIMGALLQASGMSGKDMGKLKQPMLPESLGIAAGVVYLSTMFLFFPFPFLNWSRNRGAPEFPIFPFQQLGEYSSASLSICCMLFLGFADDVLNVKWRHKVILPALASLPLLMIYSVTCGITNVVVPIPLRPLLGRLVELGPLYYVYMAGMAVFCTHSINILAGVNGVEVGQSVIIAAFIVINDIVSILKKEAVSRHLFSLYTILPFLSVSLALLKWNWFPAQVFVGDTFCYFAGMTFTVVGILGHYSKTLLLFFIPQIVNFIYSAPQLFGIIPCPRHRLPKLDEQSGSLTPSRTTMKKEMRMLGMLRVLDRLKIIKILDETDDQLTINNLTLLNWLLITFGPMKEDRLAIFLISVQAVSCTAGLYIRHRLSTFLF